MLGEEFDIPDIYPNIIQSHDEVGIFNAEIYKLKHEESPSMGAAMIAAYGLGWYPSLSTSAKQFIHFTETFKPDLKRHKEYESYS